MNLSGNYFTYAGVSSRKYGLIFANVETERITSLSGEVQSNTIFNKKDKRNYHVGELFEDSSMRFDAEVVTDDERVIDLKERREIEKWLFHQYDYRRLYTEKSYGAFSNTYEFVDGEEKRLYLNCRFVNAQKIEGNGGIAGYRFTIECDSCMAWQDEVAYEYTLSNNTDEANTTITVPADTDIIDYVYPKVTISIGSIGGSISISNLTDDAARLTAFDGLSPNVTVIMRGDGINYISGDYYQKFSRKNFVRFLSGSNELSITGNVTGIKFEFQNRRFL